MASPVGHSLFGLGIYSAANNQLNWKDAFVYVLLANLADFDFIFGFLVGAPNKYHHQFTHSIFMAAVIAGIFALFFYTKKKERFLKIFVVFFLVYCSHLAVDFFAVDNSAPFGEQLLWPFSSNYYLSNISFFMDVHKADTSGEFIPSLFSKHNFVMMLSEAAIFGTIYLIVSLYRKKHMISPKIEK